MENYEEWYLFVTEFVIWFCWLCLLLGSLNDHFGFIWRSLWIILVPCWWSSGAEMHSGRPLRVPGWIFYDLWWILGPSLESILDNFWYFMWFGLSKSALGLQTCFLTTFGWTMCSFLMSQPFKHIVNTMVFMRFHFSNCFVILMASGTYLDLIFEVSGGLQAPFWWFLRVLENHSNFMEFYDL